MDIDPSSAPDFTNPLQGLDFISQFLLFALVVFIIMQAIYMILPAAAQAHIQKVDYDASAGHKLTYTGAISLGLLALIGITQAQRFSQHVDRQEKLQMSAAERSFKLRSKFSTEIVLYCLIMISSVFMALNHMMSVDRKKHDYEFKISKLDPKEKGANEKKND